MNENINVSAPADEANSQTDAIDAETCVARVNAAGKIAVEAAERLADRIESTAARRAAAQDPPDLK